MNKETNNLIIKLFSNKMIVKLSSIITINLI